MATKKAIEAAETSEPVFSKQQLLNAKKYSNRKDILTALIDDGEEITVTELDNRMSDFMKGKVN